MPGLSFFAEQLDGLPRPLPCREGSFAAEVDTDLEIVLH